jgi:hypothetical protein
MRYAQKDQIVCSASSILELNLGFGQPSACRICDSTTAAIPAAANPWSWIARCLPLASSTGARSARYGSECIPGHCAYGSAPAELKLPGFFFSALAFISTGGWLFRVQRIPFAPDVKPRLVHEPLNAVENVRQAAGVIPDSADISWVEMNWNATQSTTNACYDANLVEETGRKLDVSDGLRFNPRVYEIKTFKLQFGKSK